jgi:O-antigen/teichoic acid export membrane protein
MSFGSRITAISLLSEIRTALPEVFLGKLQGMTDTGLFSRGQGLVAMFDRLVMDAVNPVAYTLFAKRVREGKDAASVFVDASALITAFGWSFLGCLGILAFPAIRVLYGTQWDAAVDPTRWMSAAMAIAVPANVCMAPLVASGALDKVLRVAILSTSVNVVLVGIGAHLGLLSLTQMMVPAAAISGSLWLWLAWHRIGFRWTGLFRVYAKSAAVAAGAMSIPLIVTLWMGWRSEDILTLLLVAVPGAAGGFVVAAYLTRHAVWGELVRAIKPLP